MRKFGLLISAVVAIAIQASSASATLFNWTFDDGTQYSGGGVIDATLQSGVTYFINTISGSVTDSILSTVTPIVTAAPNGYAVSGNIVFYDFNGPPQPVVTETNGFGFSLTNGQFFAIYEDFGNVGGLYDCNDAPYCLIGPGTSAGSDGLGPPADRLVGLVSLTLDPVVGQTPIPGALPLFATGLGALGLMGWRRKRKQAVAA
jgi:hypothetical protein